MAHGLDGTLSYGTIGFGTIGGVDPTATIGDPTAGLTDPQIAAQVAADNAQFPSPIVQWSPTTGPTATPVWVDITTYVRQGSVTRGRSSEFDSIQAGKLTLELDNTDRTFDPTYNANCRPRKQIRVLAGYGNTHLRASGASLSGMYSLDSDAGRVNIPGDIDLRVHVAMDDWTPASTGILIAKQFFTAAQGGFGFGVDTGGHLVMNWTTNGASGTITTRTSTAVMFVANGVARWVRATLDADNGAGGHTVRFYWSADTTSDHSAVSWTLLGSAITTAGTATMYTGTAPLTVGALADNLAQTAANFYQVAILDGIGGTAVRNVDFTDPDQFGPSAASGTDANGRTWVVSHGITQPDGLIGNTFPVFRGHIDGLPQEYPAAGHDSIVSLDATDGFWLAEQFPMEGAYAEAVRADNPSGWWRMDDNPPDDTLCADSSGSGLDGQYVGSRPDKTPKKADGPLIADGGTAIYFNDNHNDKVWLDPASNITAAPFTVEAWVQSATVVENRTAEIVCQSFNSAALGTAGVGNFVLDGANGILDTNTLQAGGATPVTGSGWDLCVELAQQAVTNLPLFSFTCDAGTTTTAVGTTSIGRDDGDGNPTHLVGTVGFDRRARLYVNGVLAATAPSAVSTTAMAGGGTTGRIRFAAPPTTVDGSVYRSWGGTLDEVAIYPSALTATQIAAHYGAGFDAWAGDLPGTRIGRMLDLIDWPTGDRDIDTGSSILSGDIGSQSALNHMQAVATTERARMFVTGDGKFRFIGRHAELTDTRSLVAQATFSPGVGDYADLSFDYGTSTLANDVTVSPQDGADQRVTDPASIAAYGTQSLSITGTLQTAADARGLAEWELLHYSDPLLRTSGLKILPSRDPAVLFSDTFGLELGDRVSVTRVLPGADIVSECILEGVSHQFSPDGLWAVTLQLSPANTLTGFLILNDATDGLLNTAALAY